MKKEHLLQNWLDLTEWLILTLNGQAKADLHKNAKFLKSSTFFLTEMVGWKYGTSW